MNNYVIVPDGLDALSSDGQVQVSWVYQTVLDEVLNIVSEDDTIILAPANNFGQSLTEHQAAEIYLKSRNHRIRILCPQIQSKDYIDTRGNAIYLREYLIRLNVWPLESVVLCAYAKHARRAAMLFNQEGFDFTLKAIDAHSQITKRKIVSRLWYYNIPLAHDAYEFIAYIFFKLGIK